jgi:hypothetical protein
MECGDVISWPMDTDLPVDLRLLQLLLPRKGLMCTTARSLHEHVAYGAEPWISSALLVCSSIDRAFDSEHQ